MNLREIFEHYGMTQRDLVSRLSMKRQYAFMLWHGKRKLGHRLGKRISEEFEIPLNELLYPYDVTRPCGRPRIHPKRPNPPHHPP